MRRSSQCSAITGIRHSGCTCNFSTFILSCGPCPLQEPSFYRHSLHPAATTLVTTMPCDRLRPFREPGGPPQSCRQATTQRPAPRHVMNRQCSTSESMKSSVTQTCRQHLTRFPCNSRHKYTATTPAVLPPLATVRKSLPCGSASTQTELGSTAGIAGADSVPPVIIP